MQMLYRQGNPSLGSPFVKYITNQFVPSYHLAIENTACLLYQNPRICQCLNTRNFFDFIKVKDAKKNRA